MTERPKLNIVLTKADKALEVAGWLLLCAVWGWVLTHYVSLPDTVPTHFNAAGVTDRSGDKWTILILPVLATILYTGLTVLNRFPHIFNYPITITRENAMRHYTNATRLIRYMKLIVVVVLGLVAYQVIRNASGKTGGPGLWLLPLIIGMILTPVVIYLSRTFQTRE